jgi:hypothetical protein
MTFDWQNLAAAVIVVAAVGFLARWGWRSLRRAGGCGSCGDCPSTSEQKQVVPLQPSVAGPRRGSTGGEGPAVRQQ